MSTRSSACCCTTTHESAQHMSHLHSSCPDLHNTWVLHNTCIWTTHESSEQHMHLHNTWIIWTAHASAQHMNHLNSTCIFLCWLRLWGLQDQVHRRDVRRRPLLGLNCRRNYQDKSSQVVHALKSAAGQDKKKKLYTHLNRQRARTKIVVRFKLL